MSKYRVKVHKKGLIVIPAEVRKALGIHEGSYLELIIEGKSVRLIAPKDLREEFGADGEKALEVARLINVSRRREVEEEIYS